MRWVGSHVHDIMAIGCKISCSPVFLGFLVFAWLLVASCGPRRKLVVLIPFYFFVVSWKISNLQNTSLLRWYHKSAIWFWNTSERILCYRSDSVSKFSVRYQCFKASITWRYFKKIQDQTIHHQPPVKKPVWKYHCDVCTNPVGACERT